MQYFIFRTRLGWFGICGNKQGLVRTCLPGTRKSVVKRSLLKGMENPKEDPALLKSVQNSIRSYYEGTCVDFRKVPVCLEEGLLGEVLGVVVVADSVVRVGVDVAEVGPVDVLEVPVQGRLCCGRGCLRLRKTPYREPKSQIHQINRRFGVVIACGSHCVIACLTG